MALPLQSLLVAYVFFLLYNLLFEEKKKSSPSSLLCMPDLFYFGILGIFFYFRSEEDEILPDWRVA